MYTQSFVFMKSMVDYPSKNLHSKLHYEDIRHKQWFRLVKKHIWIIMASLWRVPILSTTTDAARDQQNFGYRKRQLKSLCTIVLLVKMHSHR